jgi:PAS domain S-box-containing protein
VSPPDDILRQLGALADMAPTVLWITDPAGVFTFVSRRWQEDTGQPPPPALDSGWAEVVHPDEASHVQAVLKEALSRREPFAVDFRLRQADGTYRWAVVTGRPHLGPGAEGRGFIGAVADIDDRKRAELALRRTQQAARFLANASVALADMADPRSALGKVASLSVPFFADWCVADFIRDDRSLERLVVAHSEPRKAASAREVARRWLPAFDDAAGPGRVARTGHPELVEELPGRAASLWARDEEHARMLEDLGFASYICVPVRWDRKTRAVLTLVGGSPARRFDASDLRVAEDLAHRASLSIENAELYRAAVDADRRKDEFLAVLSHELRTPLNAIVGWTHILREGTAPPEMVRKGMDAIHRNAQIQTQLISDILDVSRIVAGKLRLEVRPIELPVVIEAAVETLRPAADARRVRLETVLDPGAGPISGDASRLQQVVWNLLSNAIKFVPEKTGRVHVRLEAINSHVRVSVVDNGPGIDPAFLPHVFERFRQADSTTNRVHQGLGLGLAIVRHLVELHGGTVRAENREDRSGAIFTVELPRRSVAAPPPASEAEQRHPNVEEPIWLEAAPSLRGVKVAVVDDQADARDLVRAVLERCGATVTAAASAREVLDQIKIHKPDVVIADIEMPEQSGYDFLRDLRALAPAEGGNVPVIALTAHATAHDRVKALRAGFQMHVAKPVQPAELAAVVESLLRRAPEGP